MQFFFQPWDAKGVNICVLGFFPVKQSSELKQVMHFSVFCLCAQSVTLKILENSFYKELLLICWFCEHLFLQTVLWKVLYCFSFKILQLKTSNQRVIKGLLIKISSFYRNGEYQLPIRSIQPEHTHTQQIPVITEYQDGWGNKPSLEIIWSRTE